MTDVKEEHMDSLIKNIRKIVGRDVLVTFRTTAKGFKFHSAEIYESDYDDLEPDKKLRKLKLKSLTRPTYFG